MKRNKKYAVMGCLLGISAPIGWDLVHVIFFGSPDMPFWQQFLQDIVRSPYQTGLYVYMGIGTAAVMGFLGYFIGKRSDEVRKGAEELNELHQEVALQKELFENRYKVLDNNIKNFHQISSRIQKSMDVDEVLSLCSNGLHNILGYERVNILMVDEQKENLVFVSSTGTEGFDPHGVTIPLDDRSGIIFHSMVEKKVLLIEDMGQCPKSYHLQPPFDAIKPLRSRSFVLCPIVVKGEAVGIFGIDNKFSHRALNDTDVDTIKLFADQAASSMIRINLLRAIDTLTCQLGKTFSDLLQNREQYSRNILNLKNSVGSMADSTSHIASASESVLTSVDDTSSAIGEISVSIEEVSRNLDSLSEIVDKSVAALEQINATLKNVEQNTSASYKVASQVKGEADNGRVVVGEMIAALAEIQNAVELSYNGIRRLSDNSSRIDSIVNVISDITKRTNLLALNASIIAAQAGEYGKSFGVVADEIRNLSLQTGHSTGEITGIIEEIMNESRIAADNVTLTKDLVSKGVRLGKDTGDSLKVILDISQQALHMTEQIKNATEEQADSARMVTQSMEDVSSMTSQIFSASKEQTNATRNIARAIESIKDMTQEMVAATSRQVQDGNEIKKSVDAVGCMVVGMFDDLENRRAESGVVVKELEIMKEISR